jgi:hypothetical protein
MINGHQSVLVSAPGLSLMVSFALRYAYDRPTAAAHAIIGQVLPIFSQLPQADQAQIRQEIQRELDRGGVSSLNIDDWQRFLDKTKPTSEDAIDAKK